MAEPAEPLPHEASTPASRRKRVLSLALPAVGEQVLNTMVSLANTFLVGHLRESTAERLGYASAPALAAVGFGNELMWVAMVVFMATGVGVTALVARARGAGDMGLANQALRQAMLLGLALGALVSALGPLAVRPVLELLGAAPDVVPIGTQFLQILLGGFIPAALLVIGTAALRGAGDTTTPLMLMLGVNGLNLLLSWLLINGELGMPGLGAAGAAIGQATARGAGGLALLAILLRGRTGLRLVPSLRPDWPTLGRIVRVGLPSGAESMVFQGGLLVFITYVTALGTAAFAAHNVVISVESLSFLPGMGYAAAASALVGQALGARQPEEASALGYEALLQGGLMMVALGALMIIFPQPMLQLFVADPQVVAEAIGPLQLAGVMQIFLAANFIISGGLRGAGDTSWPLYTKIISTWGVRLPLTALSATLGLGLTGIWGAMLVDYVIQSSLALWRFRSGRWKQMRV